MRVGRRRTARVSILASPPPRVRITRRALLIGLVGSVAALTGGRGARAAGDAHRVARERMVREQIVARGVKDPGVLGALRRVPRHEFVPVDQQPHAYDDNPLPIGSGQTISQPYIVALMTELAAVTKTSRVLEVGTGSGYQAAVLAELAGAVYSIEIVEPLARSAAATLRRLGYDAVRVRHGDGYRGWPEHAPFDAIVVTAAPARIPEPLQAQLAPRGRLVIPVGSVETELVVLTRTGDGFTRRTVTPVRFVPMTGEAEREGGAR
jgi:protein-L-isoaspartate(D-aspartate) O-methyltransferase